MYDTTFSIVARCPHTGCLAVAVTTARLAVGNRVPFAVANVAAIATQADTNPELAINALELIAAGADAEEALQIVLAADAGRGYRQLSIIDSRGNCAVFTGADVRTVFPWGGSFIGNNCVAAGNLLASEHTPQAMVQAFEKTSGFIGGRVLAALTAGQAAGGDRRGKVSAAMLVTGATKLPLLDLRIDSAADPVSELQSLYSAYVKAFPIPLNYCSI